jgi:hypothetical protein
MWTLSRLLSIAFLSSALCFFGVSSGLERPDIQLGFVQFETLRVSESGGKHLPFVVVRVTNKANDVQSFGISNEAGVLGMPLPPGQYCYDAFSRNGSSFQMNRSPSDRCFTVRADQTEEVGVGVKQ